MIQSAEAHILNLFADVELLAIRSRVESRSPRDYSWFGYIPGDEFGRVVITVVRGKFGMSAIHKGKRYVVLPAPTGLYEVQQIDRLYDRYRRNGITQREHFALQDRIQRVRQQIRWERQEGRQDRRYGY